MADAKEVVTALTEELKGLDVQLSSLTSSLTIEELREQVAGLEKQVHTTKQSISDLHSVISTSRLSSPRSKLSMTTLHKLPQAAGLR